jgi:hypothetical protein
MRVALLFLVCVCLAASNLSAGTVQYLVTAVGPHDYHYVYLLNGLTFLQNQELDIRFDPTVFGSLSNASAGSGFSLIPCCQPNNPPGAFGDYAIQALSDTTSPSGTFSVDAFVPSSAYPGTQPFYINQLDAGGNYLYNVTAGFTELDPPDPSPEPANRGVIGMGLLIGVAWWTGRRRLRSALGRQ